MTMNERPEHVDVTVDIPTQDGLAFPIHLNLQNGDELHLVANHGFWLEWFPCTTPQVRDPYRRGMRSFRARIAFSKSTGKSSLRAYRDLKN
jgi:hypothetical protein